jgi:hypothetical protein
MEESASTPMPLYRSHKKVWALQISAAESVGNMTRLEFAVSRFAPRSVPSDVTSRYFPKPGDYFVQYEDGYMSISPQKAFEDGYTLVGSSMQLTGAQPDGIGSINIGNQLK